MKVAIDVSPIATEHKVRGIGAYAQCLKDEFEQKKIKGVEFDFFHNSSNPPPADILHYTYFDLFQRTLKVPKTSRVVVTIHDVIPLIFPSHFPVGLRGSVNLFFQKRALKQVAAVIADSETSKSDIASKLSYPKERIHVVYLAPAKKFKKLEKVKLSSSLSIPEEFILYVGDVNWNKNMPNLLKAIKIANVNLVMVGKALTDDKNPQTEKINKLINELGLSKNITKTGYIGIDDLVDLYNLAKLTVMPSYYEGFGLPVLESMACGTPVVCSNIASLSEITDSYAFHCDPEDEGDIARKIIEVSNLDKDDRKRISSKIQEHAARFTWQIVSEKTADVYKAITI